MWTVYFQTLTVLDACYHARTKNKNRSIRITIKLCMPPQDPILHNVGQVTGHRAVRSDVDLMVLEDFLEPFMRNARTHQF